jgi:hypothetical protein
MRVQSLTEAAMGGIKIKVTSCEVGMELLKPIYSTKSANQDIGQK